MTKKERLEIYETFFHKVNMYCLTLNHEKFSEAVGLINAWSYAHRSGNGSHSEHEQKKLIENMIQKMKDF